MNEKQRKLAREILAAIKDIDLNEVSVHLYVANGEIKISVAEYIYGS
jgi:hypothetical protein